MTLKEPTTRLDSNLVTTPLFKAEWGSRAYGTNTAASDRDLIQVVIEDPRYITGLDEFRPKHTSTAESGERSTADDTDMVTYGMKHFTALAVEGNPQVLATLFLKNFIERDPLFDYFQDNTDYFVSKQAGRKYLGYMTSQRKNIDGLGRGKTNRPELVHTHGWDTKFGMHAVRLGFQGLELMETGKISLPMEGVALKTCQEIRQGKWGLKDGLALMDDLMRDLEAAVAASTLPDKGNREAVSELLHIIYKKDWKSA